MLPASVHPAALLGPLVRILLAPFNPVALFISLQVRVLPAPVCPSRLRVRALQAPFGLAAAQGHAGAQFALGSGMSMTRRPSRTRRGHPLVPARRGQGHADALFSLGAMHVAARGCPAGATPRPALLLRGSGARGGERHVRRVRPGRGLCQGAGAARDYAPSPPVVWMPITADDCLWVSEYVGLRSVGRVSQKAAGVAACIPTTRPLRGQAPVVYAARCSMYPPGSKS